MNIPEYKKDEVKWNKTNVLKNYSVWLKKQKKEKEEEEKAQNYKGVQGWWIDIWLKETGLGK